MYKAKDLDDYARYMVSRIYSGHREPLRAAFASTHRADFLGPAPWTVRQHYPLFGWGWRLTRNKRDCLTDTVIPLDASKNINNGQPTFWAQILDQALYAPSPTTFLHRGCGAGYYTYLIAQLFPDAQVHFVDTHPRLVPMAQENLREVPNASYGDSEAS